MNFIETLYSIDFAILDFIQNTIKCVFLDYLMTFFSSIGNAGIIWIITALIMMCFKKTRATGAMMACALLLGVLIGEVGIKNIVARERPFVVNTDILLNIAQPSGYSFPSGHTCSSFAAATTLFMNNKKIGIVAYIIASLIAFSRLYNYVHFPSDILCGIILGITVAIITVSIFRKTGLDTKLSGNLKCKKELK